MTVLELIEKLKTLPQDMPVSYTESGAVIGPMFVSGIEVETICEHLYPDGLRTIVNVAMLKSSFYLTQDEP